MSSGVVVMKSAPAWHASLMERMELEGIVGQANHAGKREILVEEEDSGAWTHYFHGKTISPLVESAIKWSPAGRRVE